MEALIMRFYGSFSAVAVLTMVVDLGLVGLLGYQIVRHIRGTRAVPLISGLVTIVLGYAAATFLGLKVLEFILERFFIMASVAIPVIFQPELRRALERLGHRALIPARPSVSETKLNDMTVIVERVVKAAVLLSQYKLGALIVFERETGLSDFVPSGIKMDALVSTELLTSLFAVNMPLHDGAVVIRDRRVAAASCWLPLSDSTSLDHELGTRHRAGVGITEQSDAVAVIVSEETGHISMSFDGTLRRNLSEQQLRESLKKLFPTVPSELSFSWLRWP